MNGMINARCNCGRRLKLRDDLAGKRVKCPECRAAVDVPSKPTRNSRTKPRTKQTRRRTNNPRPPAIADDFYDGEPAVAPKRKRGKKRKSKPVPVNLIVGVVIACVVLGGGGFLAFYFGRGIVAELSGEIVEPTVVEYRGHEFQIPAAAELDGGYDFDLIWYDTTVARQHENGCDLPTSMIIRWYDYYPVDASDKPQLQKLLSATNSRDALMALLLITSPDSEFSEYKWGEPTERTINGLPFATIDFEHKVVARDTTYGRLYCCRDGNRQVVYAMTNTTGHGSSDMKLFDNICATIRKVGDPPVAKSPQERKQEAEAVVLQRWTEFLDAQHAGNTQASLKMMHSKSTPIRQEMQDLALSASREELNQLPFWKVFSVLSLRAGHSRRELQTPAVDNLAGTMLRQDVRSFRSMQTGCRVIGDYAEIIDQQQNIAVSIWRQEDGIWMLCPYEHAEKFSRQMELAAMSLVMQSGDVSQLQGLDTVRKAAAFLKAKGISVPANLFDGPRN